MSLADRISNKTDELGGRAKEAVGKIIGDDDLRAEGKTDQIRAALMDAAGNVKKAVEDMAEKVKDAVEDVAEKAKHTLTR
ncbi:CsbD family protein [Nocardia sp. NPDC050710]|uniref:CsbD family protein n=1 Tax=Nocardia sp. NPDC050710 TaxID=3157220 RepID=UPI0033EACAED